MIDIGVGCFISLQVFKRMQTSLLCSYRSLKRISWLLSSIISTPQCQYQVGQLVPCFLFTKPTNQSISFSNMSWCGKVSCPEKLFFTVVSMLHIFYQHSPSPVATYHWSKGPYLMQLSFIRLYLSSSCDYSHAIASLAFLYHYK